MSSKDTTTTLTFTTTLIGDHLQMAAGEFVVMNKYTTERRILLQAVGKPHAPTESYSEFDFNHALPVLLRGKGKT